MREENVSYALWDMGFSVHFGNTAHYWSYAGESGLVFPIIVGGAF